jgi:sugar lactone lactonase YvrE
MFKRIFAFFALAFALSGTQSWAQTGCGGDLPPCAPTGETVYLSTFSGNQIIRVVDSSPPSVSVIYTNTSASPAFLPEDIVVGPDNKIYVCDAIASRIWRVTPAGAAVKIYDASTAAPPNNPHGGEGPSFNSAGDLFFNTRNDSGTPIGIWKIAGPANIPDSGPFTPVQVFSNSFFGEGTVFDSRDNLLFVDGSGNRVLESSPPYTAESVLITDPTGTTFLSIPIGIATNSQNDIFVGNLGLRNINRFSPSGAFLNTYATFSSPDSPVFMQFDASDNLFVVTVQNGSADHGKLWRIPPVAAPLPATPALVVDLSTVGALPTSKAVGLGLPATTFTTAQQLIFPGGRFTFTDGNIINEILTIPANANMGGAVFKSASFMQIAPAVFNSTRLPGTPQSPNWSGGRTPLRPGAACTLIAGTGGNCIVIEDLCFDVNDKPIHPCNISAPTTLIKLASHYKTLSPQPNPGMIIADDGANDWADITNSFDPSDPTIGGGTKVLNTDLGIVNLGPCSSAGDDAEGDGDEQGSDGHKGHFHFCNSSREMDFDEADSGIGMRGGIDAVTFSGNQATISGTGALHDGTPLHYIAVVLGNAPVIGANNFAISWITSTGSVFQTSGPLTNGYIVVRAP